MCNQSSACRQMSSCVCVCVCVIWNEKDKSWPGSSECSCLPAPARLPKAEQGPGQRRFRHTRESYRSAYFIAFRQQVPVSYTSSLHLLPRQPMPELPPGTMWTLPDEPDIDALALLVDSHAHPTDFKGFSSNQDGYRDAAGSLHLHRVRQPRHARGRNAMTHITRPAAERVPG